MTMTTPMGQLLARQPEARFADWLLVAPPADEGLLHGGARRILTLDHAVAALWRRAGHEVHEGLEFALPATPAGVLLFWPKTLALGRWWIEELCRQLPLGTPLMIVGEHHGGVRRVPKMLEALGMACQRVDNARRCSLFESATVAMAEDDQWESFEALALTLVSHPGVFGHGRVDEGTQMLLAALPELHGRVLEIGCGDGVIAATLARGGAEVTAVDSNHLAVEATRRTLAANGLEAAVQAGDMLEGIEGRFEAIVTNPPFHQERQVDTDPTRRLIASAARHLVPGGALYLVANAFLPYRAMLEANFSRVEVISEDRRFRVYRAGS
ncbi:16S rRNA m(2)G 1207 methyltransferase [Kushneria sinocarnis]|uniref:16S rRNA m(2)G 1207 methyltransferase n=1 Tax=Kushneria sinocarnis TaxID=595502 RepID=A0A420WT44_9GAMM|nr:class I SAM-dependent methyltransferase [Kushneria sinocarnis]RKQ96266.1 16S rRNA m(2)G 1207 methyltransferase [Kushneria sinocarnis]